MKFDFYRNNREFKTACVACREILKALKLHNDPFARVWINADFYNDNGDEDFDETFLPVWGFYQTSPEELEKHVVKCFGDDVFNVDLTIRNENGNVIFATAVMDFA